MTSSNGHGNGGGSLDNYAPISEVQFAHDVLKLILQHDLGDEIDLDLDEETEREMAASMNVLCWILGHDNTSFKNNMVALEQELAKAGVEFDYNPLN